MVSIGDLPEDVMLEVLSFVPARHLVCSCRMVCLFWRDLVDLSTLWKRKCQQEGYHSKTPDSGNRDWRIFYFLCGLKRNLIRNPCAEDAFNSWSFQSNEGDKWKVEELPGDCGKDFPDPHIRKYFVTSYGPCIKFQLFCLRDEGYWDELMDETRPDIVVKDWYAARFDSGCQYQLTVQLLSADYIVLQEFHPSNVILDPGDVDWCEVSHTFHNYPPGVRHILFSHGGQDTQYWAGWFGVRVTNSSLIIDSEVAE